MLLSIIPYFTLFFKKLKVREKAPIVMDLSETQQEPASSVGATSRAGRQQSQVHFVQPTLPSLFRCFFLKFLSFFARAYYLVFFTC